MQNFFPVIYAKSSVDSSLRFDVSAMTFASSIENLQITEFEARYDSYMPKLFKEISFLKKNTDYLKNRSKKYLKEENLNIKNLVKAENKILKSLEISQFFMGNSLTESEKILGYMDI